MRSPILTCLDSLDINNPESIITSLHHITTYLDRVLLIEESLFPELYKDQDPLSKQFNAALSSLTNMHERTITDAHLRKLHRLLTSPFCQSQKLGRVSFQATNLVVILIKKFEIDNPHYTIELNLDNPQGSFQKIPAQKSQAEQVQKIKEEIGKKQCFYHNLRISYLLDQNPQQIKKCITKGNTPHPTQSSLRHPSYAPNAHQESPHDLLILEARKLIQHCKRRKCLPDSWEVRATQALLSRLEKMKKQQDYSSSNLQKMTRLIGIIEKHFSVHRNNQFIRILQTLLFSFLKAVPLANLFFSIGLMIHQYKQSGAVTDYTSFLLCTQETRSSRFAKNLKKKLPKQQTSPPSPMIPMIPIPIPPST